MTSKINGLVDSATSIQEWMEDPGLAFGLLACDSPIETAFFHDVFKFASDQLLVGGQRKVQTDIGTFILDFYLLHRTTGRAIGIECDGKSYHSVAHDSPRDQAIIKSGHVAAIYRLAGKDIHHSPGDLLHLLSMREPWAFSDHYHCIAEQTATWPTLRSDDDIPALDGVYRAVRRTYFEYVDDDLPVDQREIIHNRTRTPTVLKFISGPGFPSAFEVPHDLIPVPMPKWKSKLNDACTGEDQD